MRFYFQILAAAASCILPPMPTPAQERILIVQVVDTRDRPVAGVILSTKGEGAVGQPTDISGKTRIRLAPGTHAGGWVSLLLVKVMDGRDLVFLSPWDGRARVPPFENESDDFVPVVVTGRTERQVLEGTNSLRGLLLTFTTKRESQKQPRKRFRRNGGNPSKRKGPPSDG